MVVAVVVVALVVVAVDDVVVIVVVALIVSHGGRGIVSSVVAVEVLFLSWTLFAVGGGGDRDPMVEDGVLKARW